MKHVIFSYSHTASGSSGSWMCVFPSVKSILCLITQSCPTLCDPMDIALQAPLSMGFSRQEYWSRCVPCPPPGDLSNPGIEPRSPTLQADSLLSEPPGKPKVCTTRGLNWGKVLSLPLDYAMDHVCRMEPVKAEVPRIYESQCVCVCVCVCVCMLIAVWLCNPMDWSLPGSSVHGIFQTRRLEWVAISCSRGSSWLRDRTWVSCISCIGRQVLYHLRHLFDYGSRKTVASHKVLQGETDSDSMSELFLWLAFCCFCYYNHI